LISLGGGYHGQSDTGVTRGGFDENSFTGGDLTPCLGLGDHGEGDAVLDAVGGVGGFELGDDFGAAFGGDLVEFDEGCVTDEFEDAVGDFGSLGQEGGGGDGGG